MTESVLRVDLRLRPFGDSGPLVASFASFEDYLPRHGREWERYAYVKARAVTAPEAYADLYASAVRPFVYRRYLDYGVFESLREMKALIEREVERRELADHVKLGPGGIREIEFIVQAFQIIRGGQDRRLQTTSLLSALALLGTWKRLPPGMADELRAAYVFLRRLENRLQMIGDAQVHRLAGRCARARAHRTGHGGARLDGAGGRVESASRDREPPLSPGRVWQRRSATVAPSRSISGGSGIRRPRRRRSPNRWREPGFAASDEAARLLLELRSSALVRKFDEPGASDCRRCCRRCWRGTCGVRA